MAQRNLSKAAQARIRGYSEKSVVVENLATVRKRDNLIALVASATALLVAFGAQVGYGLLHTNDMPTSVPSSSIAEGRDWRGSLKVAGLPVEFTLNGALAPQAVSNFVALSRANFFNELANTCHRVTTKDLYVLQCGDPQGDGMGDPGYKWGPIENAPASGKYPSGTIAMARAGGDGNSMGSQFFFVYADTSLPADTAGGYTVMGKVTSGLENIAKLAAQGVVGGKTDGRPIKPISLSDVSVK